MLEISPLFAVIALPALAPLLALIQLLFPGLLGDHWKHYRSAVSSLMSQSTLMFAQWIALTWLVPQPTWWLSDQSLAWGMTLVAAIGFLASLVVRPQPAPVAPARIEFLALGTLGTVSGCWLAWQWSQGGSLLDQVLVVTIASAIALMHLRLREGWARRKRRASFATEAIFLFVLASGGVLLTTFVYARPNPSRDVESVKGEWTTYRQNRSRTGALSANNRMPKKPRLLWSSRPPVARGDVHFDGSPIVVDGLVYLGGYSQVLASREGIVWCVNARDGRTAGGQRLSPGETVWLTQNAGLRPIFASPTIRDSILYLGDGYHTDANCSLLAFDARSGSLLNKFVTTSHVESTPTIEGNTLCFGAGDDGVYCVESTRLPNGSIAFKERWHRDGVHVDSGPLVANGIVYVGGVIGDIVKTLQIKAIDLASGKTNWVIPKELPIAASPSSYGNDIVIAQGNGKLSAEAVQPRGEVARLDGQTGATIWSFPLSTSVLTSPVAVDDRVYLVARNGDMYALDGKSGERLWKAEAGEAVVAAPIVSEGAMIVLTISGKLLAHDLASGKAMWEFALPRSAQEVFSSPVLVDGCIYASSGGRLYAIGDEASE